MSTRQQLITNGTIVPSCVVGKTAKARAKKATASAQFHAKDVVIAAAKIAAVSAKQGKMMAGKARRAAAKLSREGQAALDAAEAAFAAELAVQV